MRIVSYTSTPGLLFSRVFLCFYKHLSVYPFCLFLPLFRHTYPGSPRPQSPQYECRSIHSYSHPWEFCRLLSRSFFTNLSLLGCRAYLQEKLLGNLKKGFICVVSYSVVKKGFFPLAFACECCLCVSCLAHCSCLLWPMMMESQWSLTVLWWRLLSFSRPASQSSRRKSTSKSS